jgi:hypothetical protein
MVVVARKIWFRHNSVVHGGVFTCPNQVFREANDSLDEFRRINAREPDVRSSTPNANTAIQKKKLCTCTVKINWDIAVDQNEGCILLRIMKVLFWLHKTHKK